MRIPAARIHFAEDDKAEILRLIRGSLDTGQLTLGPLGQELEQQVAKFLEVPHAVAVNSGTSALEIILRGLGVQGKEVVVPTNTFFATALAALHAGNEVRLADVDPATLALDVPALEAALTPRAGAVIHVHIAGIITPQMDDLRALCRARGVVFIEDACHALGSSWRGRMAGTFAAAAAFSFYPTKVITSGEGGMIVTNTPALDSEARLYRDQGKASFTQNIHDRAGYNWRFSEVHAAVGLVHFRRCAEFIAERQQIARWYDEALRPIEGIRSLPIPAGCSSNFYKYVAVLDEDVDRAALKQHLRAHHQVSLSGEVYALPLHLQPYFQSRRPAGDFRRAESICARHVCLPVYQGMTQGEVQRVAEGLAAGIRHLRAVPRS